MSNCDYPTVYTILGSSQIVTLDLGPRLANGVLLTGTPTAVDADITGELTISYTQINTVADTENEVEIGKAVQFLVSTSAAVESTYQIKVTAETDGTPSETLVDYLYVTFC